MENKKINVAELLKNCPKGMELGCEMFNNVTLLEVEEGAQFPISIRVGIDDTYILTEYGEWPDGGINAKCVIFPKGKDTWEGFVPPCKFKEGDIIYAECKYDDFIFIYKESDKYLCSYVCVSVSDGKFYYGNNERVCRIDRIKKIHLATEEEKEKLFQAIKENGYKWNAEKKCLEKLIVPKFKVGDRIKRKTSSHHYFVAEIRDNSYLAIYNHGEYPYLIPFVNEKYYELVLDKFDTNTLEPFDKVLVRSADSEKWKCDFFSNYEEAYLCKFKCVGCNYQYCIPYKGNEHLLGTTDDCDNFYKTWEE